ncbi:hypothetical protein PLICRDRAFT_35004 [Plicaturopsis crispa FD-325 SS-3]|nr:hypothetical protein PLICRDRAFT_35004 [Plicaturopsis crispa FD-325 SS-3]
MHCSPGSQITANGFHLPKDDTIAHTGHAPINMLPSELLSAIFDAGHEMDAQDKREDRALNNIQKHLRPFRALICSISRHWRDTAIGNPRLWDTVHVNRSVKFDITILVEVLRRSKAVGLTLAINDHGFPVNDPILDAIFAHIDRWKVLTIVVFGRSRVPQFSPMFRQLESAYAPKLSRLDIALDGAWSFAAKPPPFYLLKGGAPSLQHMSYTGLNPQQAFPPHSCVTTLNLSCIHIQLELLSFDEFFSGFTSLEKLDIQDGFVQKVRWSDSLLLSVPTILPSLRSITFRHLHDMSSGHVSDMLAFIEAPLLDTIAFISIDCINEWVFDTVMQPTPRGTMRLPAVRTLSIRDCDWSRADAKKVMQAFPQLSNLVISLFWYQSDSYFLSDVDGEPLGVNLAKIILGCPLPQQSYGSVDFRALRDNLVLRRERNFTVPTICVPAGEIATIPADSLSLIEPLTSVEEIEEDLTAVRYTSWLSHSKVGVAC